MEEELFTDKEKAEMFNEIAAHFYERNFGSFSKSDMELLMFKFYMDKLTELARGNDDLIDYGKCSDYKISKTLGLTQQRVRNLKVKKELVYPKQIEGDEIANDIWKRDFAKLIDNARYDEDSRKVFINIPDPNLYLEIQNFLEERGEFIEKQLNSKLLVIRAEYFIELVVNMADNETQTNLIKRLKKQFKENGDNNAVLDEKHIGKSLIKGALNLTEVASSLFDLIPATDLLSTALIAFLQKM